MKLFIFLFAVALAGAAIGFETGYFIAKDHYKCDEVGGTSSAYGQKVNGVFVTDEHTYKICK